MWVVNLKHDLTRTDDVPVLQADDVIKYAAKDPVFDITTGEPWDSIPQIQFIEFMPVPHAVEPLQQKGKPADLALAKSDT